MTPELVAVPVAVPPAVTSTTSTLNDESSDVHEISAEVAVMLAAETAVGSKQEGIGSTVMLSK